MTQKSKRITIVKRVVFVVSEKVKKENSSSNFARMGTTNVYQNFAL